MRIKVLRDYSGEEGTDADKNVEAGSEHTVTRARGSALFASGLVAILEDEAEEDEDGAAVADDQRQSGPNPADGATGDGATGQPGGQDATTTAEGEDMKTDTETKAQPAPENKQAPAPHNKASGGRKAQA